MNRNDLTLSKDRDPLAEPLRIAVTDSAKELLALEALVRQAIPMLERPEDCCTGKRLRLASELRKALRCRGEHDAGGTPPPPSGADAPAEEQYTAGYWLREDPE